MPDIVGNISAEYYYYHNGMRNLRKTIQVLQVLFVTGMIQSNTK